MMAENLVLGFDFGLKRIGVAVGYPEVSIATPLAAIEYEDNQHRFEKIASLIEEWKPARLIVGLPTHADGTAHDMTRRCQRFSQQLSGRFDLPVSLVDERYTSIIAEDLLRSSSTKKSHREAKAHIDSLSAQIVVQTYLDSLSSIS